MIHVLQDWDHELFAIFTREDVLCNEWYAVHIVVSCTTGSKSTVCMYVMYLFFVLNLLLLCISCQKLHNS